MAYASAESGYGAAALSVFHLDPSHPDFVRIPDADLLFHGALHRAGPDLILTGRDGHRHIVPGYFSGEKHPALVAPNGARLSADLVDLLAGSQAPHHYAQVQPTTPPDAIGKVEKVVGSATVIRNGTTISLQVGDAVYKSDVIQTGADSSVGVDFPDGTALNLVANTRMALNDYAYDPNGTSNSAVFSIVEGTFAFVAGKVAHTGDMRIATPVATMGIRGTIGTAQQIADATWSFAVDDGVYVLIDENGNVVERVYRIGYHTIVHREGTGALSVNTGPMTPSEQQLVQEIVRDVVRTLNLLNNPNPQSNPNPGSSTPPDQIEHFQLLLQQNNGPPSIVNTALFNPPWQPFVPSFQGGFQSPNQNTQTNNAPPTNTFIWTGGPGPWDTPGSWNPNAVPTAPIDTIVIQSGTVTYDDNYTIGRLTVAPNAALDMTGGSLKVLNGIDDSGTIMVHGDPPLLAISGLVTVESGGKIVADGGDISITDGTTTIDAGGKVVSRGRGSLIAFTGEAINNDGVLAAAHHGEIVLEQSFIVNEDGGLIEAKHHGMIEFDGGVVTNDEGAVIKAIGRGSEVKLDDAMIGNSGTIEATGRGAQIKFEGAGIDNWGSIVAALGGSLFFVESAITNAQGASLIADGWGADAIFALGQMTNSGSIGAHDGGRVAVESSSVLNEEGGVIGAAGFGARISFDEDGVVNFGLVDAEHGGKILFAYTSVDNHGLIEATDDSSSIKFWQSVVANDATIEAKHGGSVWIDDATVNNTDSGANDGLIKAVGHDATIYLSDADIVGGTIETAWGGSVQITDGTTVLDGSQSADGHALAVTLDGIVNVNGGAALELLGTIDNKGSIIVDAGSGGADPDLIIDGKVQLEGGGDVVLSGSGANIVGALNGDQPDVLVNVNDAISGGGFIGGDNLVVHNERGGVIDADGRDPLVIDTGAHTILNAGLLEASNGSELVLDSHVANTGEILADGGTVQIDANLTNFGVLVADAHGTIDVNGSAFGGGATIAGGTLILGGPSNVDTTFTVGSFGTLVLDSPSSFDGLVNGFSGSSSANSDEIDLRDIKASDVHFQQDGNNAEIIIQTGVDSFTEITLTDVNAKDLRATSGSGGTVIYDTDGPSTPCPGVLQGNNDSFTFTDPPGHQSNQSFELLHTDPGPAHDWWGLIGDQGQEHVPFGHEPVGLPDGGADHWQQLVHHAFLLH